MIKAYAAHGSKQELQPFEYDPGELKPDQVEIDVTTVASVIAISV